MTKLKRISIILVILTLVCVMCGCNENKINDEEFSVSRLEYAGHDMMIDWSSNDDVIYVASPDAGYKVALCMDVGCTRDKNSCNANYKGFPTASYAVQTAFYYGNKLFVVTGDYVDNKTDIYVSGEDGTNRRLFCRLEYGPGLTQTQDSVVRGGKLYFIASNWTVETDDVLQCRYYVIEVNLKNGKWREIYDFGKPRAERNCYAADLDFVGKKLFCKYIDGPRTVEYDEEGNYIDSTVYDLFFLDTKTCEREEAVIDGERIISVYYSYGNTAIISTGGGEIYAYNPIKNIKDKLIDTEKKRLWGNVTDGNRFYFSIKPKEEMFGPVVPEMSFDRYYDMKSHKLVSSKAYYKSDDETPLNFIGVTEKYLFFRGGSSSICYADSEAFENSEAIVSRIKKPGEADKPTEIPTEQDTEAAARAEKMKKQFPTVDKISAFLIGYEVRSTMFGINSTTEDVEKYSEDAVLSYTSYINGATAIPVFNIVGTNDYLYYVKHKDGKEYIFSSGGLFFRSLTERTLRAKTMSLHIMRLLIITEALN